MNSPTRQQQNSDMMRLQKIDSINRQWTGKQRMQQIFLVAGVLATVTCAAILVQASPASRFRQVEPKQVVPLQHHERRVKRSLYELPDGAEYLLTANSGGSTNGRRGGQLRTTFSCDGLGYGYYADQDNDCKIFHVCQSFRMSDGSIYNNHWSFICGNQTIFNQVTLSCSHPEDAIPCENAKDFYHVNDYFGDVQAPSVKQEDLNQAQELVSKAYGSRLSATNQTS